MHSYRRMLFLLLALVATMTMRIVREHRYQRRLDAVQIDSADVNNWSNYMQGNAVLLIYDSRSAQSVKQQMIFREVALDFEGQFKFVQVDISKEPDYWQIMQISVPGVMVFLNRTDDQGNPLSFSSHFLQGLENRSELAKFISDRRGGMGVDTLVKPDRLLYTMSEVHLRDKPIPLFIIFEDAHTTCGAQLKDIDKISRRYAQKVRFVKVDADAYRKLADYESPYLLPMGVKAYRQLIESGGKVSMSDFRQIGIAPWGSSYLIGGTTIVGHEVPVFDFVVQDHGCLDEAAIDSLIQAGLKEMTVRQPLDPVGNSFK